MQAILYVLLRIARWAGKLFTKDLTLWVIGAWNGTRYSDNSRYLFEYINRHEPGHRAVWLTRSAAVHRRIRREGLPVHHFYSPRGIWYAVRARYVVICSSYNDLGPFCYLFPDNTVFVNLWHGTPLKRLVVRRNETAEARRRLLLGHLDRDCDAVCSASPLVTEQLQKYFAIPPDRFVESGYPRNDALLSPQRAPLNGLRASARGARRVATYMPTFREYLLAGREVDLIGDFGFDPEELDRTLRNADAVFFVKIHHRDTELCRRFAEFESERIILLRDEEIDGDVYPLLARTDVLLTDYSSVYFDFLLLDRPIVFTCFDLAHYRTLDRGFYLDYESISPGPKVADWAGAVRQLDRILHGHDGWAAERARVRRLTNRYTDPGNTRRLFHAVCRLGTQPPPPLTRASAASGELRPAGRRSSR